MSNETDLDWLAGNVPLEQVRGWIQKVGGGFNIVTSGIPPAIFGQPAWFSAREVLARRAELQNKPSWKDAPEWGEWLAQDSYGCWGWYQIRPVTLSLNWFAHSGYYSINSPGNSILGDWRDTLEQRPEQDDFAPFVRVGDAATSKQQAITPSKYTKTIHGVSVDVYDVLQAWGVSNPALQHLIKKALQCGQRGHKDNAQDLQDIIDSAIRAKELG